MTMRAGFGSDKQLKVLDIPSQYRWVPDDIGGVALNVAQVYRRLSDALAGKSSTEMGFDVAVSRHRMLAAIEEAAATGQQVRLNP